MRMMSGASFDKSYIKDQIKAHEDTVELFKKDIAAASTLPTVQAHLAKIKQIAASAGVSTN
jgi:putative membrane protein